MQKKPEMLAKIAMQASHLYAEAVKGFGECVENYSLSTSSNMCNVKKDYFEVRLSYYKTFIISG